MADKTAYCEDCVEEIPGDEVYWEEKRLYCGRCGSELEIDPGTADTVDTIEDGSAQPLYSPEDDEFDDSDEEEELIPDDERE